MSGAIPHQDLHALRELLQSMIAGNRVAEALDMVIGLLQRTSLKLAALELKAFSGSAHRREGVSTGQLGLFMDLLEQMTKAPEPAAGTEPAAPATPPAPPKKKTPKPAPHGRGKLPAHLERRDTIVPVTGEDLLCVHCNAEKAVIGYDDSEVLELDPARLFVNRNRHEKRACAGCRADAVTAPAADRVIEGGLPGPALLTNLITGKFDLGLPLNRLSRRYGQLGHAIPPSTLGDWVKAGTDLVEPLAQRIRGLVLAAHVMQADGTGLKVLDRNHPKGIRTGAMWVYPAMELPLVFFHFVRDKDKDGPAAVLNSRDGYVVVDADQKLNTLFARPGATAIEVGCNMHGRRYYFKALEGGDVRAAKAIDLYKRVYDIEEEARTKRLGHEDIKALRLEKSQPLMQELGEFAARGRLAEDPKSPLGKAFGYFDRQAVHLKRFLDDGRLPIDNGASERAIRGLAADRRVWLFAGSDDGARRTAIAFTLTASCRRNRVEPNAWWQDVLSKLSGGWLAKRMDELLPHNWALAHPEHVLGPEVPQATVLKQ